LNYYANSTADDYKVLSASTGITLNADGTVAQNINTAGERPNWGMFISVNNDRSIGRLQGTMTSGYIQDIIDHVAGPGSDDGRLTDLNSALSFLKARESGSPVTPFDVVALRRNRESQFLHRVVSG
jgi:hypothetical protein